MESSLNTRTGSERATPTIETEQQATCPLCGTHGDVVYENMRDRLFGVPGVWGSRECPSCEALWLDPRPTRASIGEAYRTYVTHGRAGAAATLAAAAIRRVARERAALEYGFDRPTPGLAQLCALACRFYPGMREAADRLIRHLPASALGSGARLLDVGCGAGGDLVFLNSLGWRASGVEIDPTAVRVARARGLEVIEGDVASAGLADETFDAVTSSHVLEHVHDPREFLLECRRVLKTGGVLVAVPQTPDPNSDPATGSIGLAWMRLDIWCCLTPTTSRVWLRT